MPPGISCLVASRSAVILPWTPFRYRIGLELQALKGLIVHACDPQDMGCQLPFRVKPFEETRALRLRSLALSSLIFLDCSTVSFRFQPFARGLSGQFLKISPSSKSIIGANSLASSLGFLFPVAQRIRGHL